MYYRRARDVTYVLCVVEIRSLGGVCSFHLTVTAASRKMLGSCSIEGKLIT